MGTQMRQMITECVAKKSMQSDLMDCLLEKYGTKILDQNGQSAQLRNAIAGLGKRQRMLEALFGKISAEQDIGVSDDEFEFYKERLDQINRHDPALSQLLEGLIAMLMHGKKAPENGNISKMRMIPNKVKQSLAYAVFFVANRYQIQLENAQGEGNDQKALLINLSNIYNDFQMDEQNAIKFVRHRQKSDHYDYDKKGNEKRERRFLRFVYHSLETDWDEKAFLIDQNDQDDDNDEGTTDRRKRRRKRNIAPPSMANYDDERAEGGEFFIYFLSMIFRLLVILFICYIIYIFYRRYTEANRMRQIVRREQLRIRLVELAEALARRDQTAAGAPNAIQLIEIVDPNECSVCLGLIESGTLADKLPCNHLFHQDCIEPWLSGHNTCPVCRRVFITAAQTARLGMDAVGSLAGQINGTTISESQNANEAAADEVVIDVPLTANTNQNNGTTVGNGEGIGTVGAVNVPQETASNHAHGNNGTK